MAPPRDGSKLYPSDAEIAQFESLIIKNSGRTKECWIMEQPLRGKYPYFIFRGEVMLAARFAYRASETKPEIPPDRPMLGRWCGEKTCVNPDHQFPIDDWRNNERTINPIGANIRKEVCPQCLGRYALEAKSGRRRCPECRARSQREWAERHKVPCIGCGEPSTNGECRGCRATRLYAGARAIKAAKKEVHTARVSLRNALQKFCEKHNLPKKQKPSGGWVCPVCNQDTRKRNRKRGPDYYKNLRAEGKCVTCHNPSSTYRCPRCHERHMASTHARRAREKAEQLTMAKATIPPSNESQSP